MYPSPDMLQQRQRLVRDIVAKHRRVKDVAEILGVTRECVSRWVARFRFEGVDGLCPEKPGPKPGSAAVNRTPEEVEVLVCAYGNQYVCKGPQALADLLEQEEGLHIDQSTVYRILKRTKVRYGLSYKRLKKKRQAYCLGMPGEELQMDVHLPFGHARKARVYDAIDDCSRFVFGRVMDGHTQANAIAFVDAVIAAAPFPIAAIRTDCGREFGKAFTKHLAGLGIAHRKNPPYTPQHNGKIERYHRTLKENAACYWPFAASLDDLNYQLQLWLQFYNHRRRHRGLHMRGLTPAQKILYASITSTLQPHIQHVTGTLQLNMY